MIIHTVDNKSNLQSKHMVFEMLYIFIVMSYTVDINQLKLPHRQQLYAQLII